MRIDRLALANVRTFRQAEFEFQRGMNLLVGVNGAGKSTVLDVLRVMFSQSLPRLSMSRSAPMSIGKNDISLGTEALTIELGFTVYDTPFTHRINLQRRDYKIDPSRQGLVREQTTDLPDLNELTPSSLPKNIKKGIEQPLVLYFSTRRSLTSLKKPTKTSSAGKPDAAFVDGLINRELRLREFAEWWLVKYALAESERQKELIDLIERMTTQFIDVSYNHLRAIDKILWVDSNDGDALDVSQLPELEQSKLIWFLELAQGLYEYNPHMIERRFDQTRAAKVVLNDETNSYFNEGFSDSFIAQLNRAFINLDFNPTVDDQEMEVISIELVSTLHSDARQRELHLRELMDWLLVEQKRSVEDVDTRTFLQYMGGAFDRFFSGYSFIRVEEVTPTVLIEKQGNRFDLRQLSDGERGMIALILDLARRLALANPQLDNPIQHGKAVVLIDEIDLHLHPDWQRKVCDSLETIFQGCQFIATTHSPQVVGEIPPERITKIEAGKASRLDQSKGMDSSWILRHVMGVDERNSETKDKLERIEQRIDEKNYEAAKTLIRELKELIPEDPMLARLRTKIDVSEMLKGKK